MAGKKKPSVFGKRLYIIRKTRGLTQEQLESKSGVPSAMISHFETGERQKASADNLVKLSKALNVSIDYLLGQSDEPELKDARVQAVLRRLSEASDEKIDDTVRVIEAMLDREDNEE